MSYITKTIKLQLEPVQAYVNERCNYLDRLPRGQPVLCVKDLRKFINLPDPAPETVWLTVTSEPLDDAVDLRLGPGNGVSIQRMSVRYPSGRCRSIFVWTRFYQFVARRLAASGGSVAYAYLEYEA